MAAPGSARLARPDAQAVARGIGAARQAVTALLSRPDRAPAAGDVLLAGNGRRAIAAGARRAPDAVRSGPGLSPARHPAVGPGDGGRADPQGPGRRLPECPATAVRRKQTCPGHFPSERGPTCATCHIG